MDKKHLSLINCIHCSGGITALSPEGVIENGIISCTKCAAQFPVIRNVPRLLKGALMVECLAYYSDICNANPELSAFREKFLLKQGNPSSSHMEKLKVETQKNFGYEWHLWKKLPDFAENHFLEVMGKPEEFFRGKCGWDPAVGMGRDLFNAVKAVGPGGFMLGSDLSFSVDMAYERCKGYPNVLIVQADLYSDMVPEKSLDFAYMIGVIQHLTEPGEGVKHVGKRVKSGGLFVGTFYCKPDSFLMHLVVATIMGMRVITTRVPLSVALFISRAFALPSYLFFKLPSFVLNRFAYIRDMEELYPTHETQKRRPDLDLLAHNWFDHFTPPIIGFYSDDEITEIMRKTGLGPHELNKGVVRAVQN